MKQLLDRLLTWIDRLKYRPGRHYMRGSRRGKNRIGSAE
jgi:hypothetical protein